jgi:hypothetical protein
MGGLLEELQGWLNTILGWLDKLFDLVKKYPEIAAVVSFILLALGPIGIALSIVLSITLLYIELMSILEAKCGGIGMMFLFISLTLGLAIFSLITIPTGLIGLSIALAIAATLLSTLFKGLMNVLNGNPILCTE